jgi:hypothetical protein
MSKPDEPYEPDFFSKKYAKENDKILISFFNENNLSGDTMRCFYLYDYVNYDDFLDFYLRIVKKETSYYPYCQGGKYEFEDEGDDEIIISDNFLTKIKIFNYPEEFKNNYLDKFIDDISK